MGVSLSDRHEWVAIKAVGVVVRRWAPSPTGRAVHEFLSPAVSSADGVALTTTMEQSDVIRRLHRMGESPVPPALAARHLAELGGPEPVAGWPWGRVAVLAAGVLALAAPAAALTVGGAAGGGRPTELTSAQAPDGLGVLSCTGPPPFAGTVPEGGTAAERGAARAAEAAELAAWREANCPPEQIDEETRPPGPECGGPPPFAGSSAEPADPEGDVVPSPRAAEAAAHAESRADCRPDGAAGTEDDVGATPEDVTTGPPAGTPTGPPASVTTGPPDETPAGPPEGVTTGPPEGVPTGPQAGTPAGPPTGTPAGPPTGVPTGAPEEAPAGPPDRVPAGPPDRVPGPPRP